MSKADIVKKLLEEKKIDINEAVELLKENQGVIYVTSIQQPVYPSFIPQWVPNQPYWQIS